MAGFWSNLQDLVKRVTNLEVWQRGFGLGATPWIAPTLINSWANIGAGATTAGYFKDALGIVHLRGRIAGGANGSAAFVLPAGYRPGGGQDFPPAGGYNGTTAVAAFAAIDTSGNVEVFFAAGATQVSLAGITFLAQN